MASAILATAFQYIIGKIKSSLIGWNSFEDIYLEFKKTELAESTYGDAEINLKPIQLLNNKFVNGILGVGYAWPGLTVAT